MLVRLSILMLVLAQSSALAEELPPISVLPPDPPAKRELIIGGQSAGSAPPRQIQRCVDVEAGGVRSYGCLNETLKRDVDKVNPSMNLPPIDARSSDTKLGIANIPAVQQQYGQNFGRSVVPFRMPQPTFNGNPRR